MAVLWFVHPVEMLGNARGGTGMSTKGSAMRLCHSARSFGPACARTLPHLGISLFFLATFRGAPAAAQPLTPSPAPPAGSATPPAGSAPAAPGAAPPPYMYQPPPPPLILHRAPYNALWVGARLGVLFPFGNAYAIDAGPYYEYGES